MTNLQVRPFLTQVPPHMVGYIHPSCDRVSNSQAFVLVLILTTATAENIADDNVAGLLDDIDMAEEMDPSSITKEGTLGLGLAWLEKLVSQALRAGSWLWTDSSTKGLSYACFHELQIGEILV